MLAHGKYKRAVVAAVAVVALLSSIGDAEAKRRWGVKIRIDRPFNPIQINTPAGSYAPGIVTPPVVKPEGNGEIAKVIRGVNELVHTPGKELTKFIQKPGKELEKRGDDFLNWLKQFLEVVAYWGAVGFFSLLFLVAVRLVRRLAEKVGRLGRGAKNEKSWPAYSC